MPANVPPDRAAPIGVFDSGVGGLSVLKQLLRLMPQEEYIYLGDSARVPYGSKSPATVRLFAQQCAHFLLERGVKLIVVACNTASALALEAVQAMTDAPVIGVIQPAAQAALQATRNGRIGVIGTRATVTSDAYARQIRALAPVHPGQNGRSGDPVRVLSQACPLFVPVVEEGWTEHPATRLIAQEYLAPVQEAGVDTLVLGCTHYPLLKPLLQELLPGIRLVGCGEHAAVQARAILAQQGALAQATSRNGNPGRARFFVTDEPATFESVAQRFLGFPVAPVERVVIDHWFPEEAPGV